MMAREKFVTLQSTAVPLPAEHVDTDQIIPARFLKATTREGFGENLFRDWRYDPANKPVSSFVLNDPRYSGKILVTGKNFGCGSSREHAAWALYDFGFRVVISSFFADIFRNNALNNGLLPVVVPESFLKESLMVITRDPGTVMTVDLVHQQITCGATASVKFEINPYKKNCLLHGQDDMDYLLGLRNMIRAFDLAHAS